jgi:DMSO/TMAO reductase YedYZ molybdopterin-dependent catalytic subunit
MPLCTQVSDFHCVTTWSCQGLKWQGIRFRDFYEQVILPNTKPAPDAINVIFKCQDGYRARMLLEDLLKDDVMLAVALNDAPLSVENGAPLRLIAPAHYGYKNAKHVETIEFHKSNNAFKPPRLRILEHQRARVAYEERGSGAPGWALRYLFRPLIKSTIKSFEKASWQYHQDNK